MTTAQRLFDQGRREGLNESRSEGLKQGETKGKAAVLKRLVQLKFGQIDELVLSRITDASSQQLDLWLQRILFAPSLDELFRP
jgi:hypothetical protein